MLRTPRPRLNLQVPEQLTDKLSEAKGIVWMLGIRRSERIYLSVLLVTIAATLVSHVTGAASPVYVSIAGSTSIVLFRVVETLVRRRHGYNATLTFPLIYPIMFGLLSLFSPINTIPAAVSIMYMESDILLGLRVERIASRTRRTAYHFMFKVSLAYKRK